MTGYKKHLILNTAIVREALQKLNSLAVDAILFVIDSDERLVGSLTDGDIRRGLLNGFGLDSCVIDIIQKQPKFLKKGCYNIQEVIEYREKGFRIIPITDKLNRVINILNFRFHKSYLPVDAIIMAGGRGLRLKPFTDHTPKPLIKIGEKPIIEYNVDQLLGYGINDIWISVAYLGEQIIDYFKNEANKADNLKYIWEEFPLGTIGAASKIETVEHEYVLIMNSDILTNLNYEDFFLDTLSKDSAFSVVTIPYTVEVPYAVLETQNDLITSFKEKPTYTYFSNGGIYLMKKEVLKLIPKDKFFNATDLMELLIEKNLKVSSYPMRGYWLDIGKPKDLLKAQEDIKHIQF